MGEKREWSKLAVWSFVLVISSIVLMSLAYILEIISSDRYYSFYSEFPAFIFLFGLLPLYLTLVGLF
ncbi:MAG: hypothetical protein AABW51_00900 [Nanoarchaeota archaeon]